MFNFKRRNKLQMLFGILVEDSMLVSWSFLPLPPFPLFLYFVILSFMFFSLCLYFLYSAFDFKIERVT